MDQTSGSPERSETNAIRLPSGEYTGTQSRDPELATWTTPPDWPGASADQICSAPDLSDTKAIRAPSRLQAGPQSFAGSSTTSCRSPSCGTTSTGLSAGLPTLIAATATSPFPPLPTVSANHLPSGDQPPVIASTFSSVSRCGVPPVDATIQIDEPRATDGGPSWPGATFGSAAASAGGGWLRL